MRRLIRQALLFIDANVLSHPIAKKIAGPAGGGGLILAGVGLAQWDEYAAALVLFLAGCIVLFLSAYHWKTERMGIKALLLVLCVLAAVVSIPITIAKKGDKPWSDAVSRLFLAYSLHRLGPMSPFPHEVPPEAYRPFSLVRPAPPAPPPAAVIPEPSERADLEVMQVHVSVDHQAYTVQLDLTLKNVGILNVSPNALVFMNAFPSKVLNSQEEDSLFTKNAGTGKRIVPIWNNVVQPNVQFDIPPSTWSFFPADLEGLGVNRVVYVTVQVIFSDRIGPLHTDYCAFYEEKEKFAHSHICLGHND